MWANDCEFGDLNLECLTVERATFKDIETLDSECIFELPGVKEVFLPSGISAVSEDAFTQGFALFNSPQRLFGNPKPEAGSLYRPGCGILFCC